MRCGGVLGFAVIGLGVAAPAAAQDTAAVETYTLGQAIETALANSQVVAEAEQAVVAANQRVREAWASALPDISASASYQRNLRVQEAFLPATIFDPSAPPDELVPVRFGSDNQWQAGLSVSQPLFRVGVFIGIGAAARFRELERERARGTTQHVVSAVRQAYFDALLAHEELRLTEQSIARVRRTLDETRAMHAAGLASEYDVLRLDVQLANIEANLQRVRNAVEATRRALLIEMGLDVERPLALAGRLDEVDLDEPAANDPANRELLELAGAPGAGERPAEEFLALAQRERADLRQLEASVDLEGARLAVERAEFYPKVSLFSTYNIQAQENGTPTFFGSGPNQRTTSATAGLRVEVPIFTGFSRSARMAQARAAVRQNEARLERAERDAANEVQTLLDGVAEARLRAASQRRAVEQAQRGFEIASAEYGAGVGSQLQVTDAEVALRESQFNYARAVYDYLSARARLDMALGTAPASLVDWRAAGRR